ncbi:MAG TPA: alkaline phosphatase family protein [Kofleriaceae bacterium]|nr:alkaline phosphatase family protein [Kofleriaceae bacterium]
MRRLGPPRETAPTRQVVIAALTLLVLGSVGAVQAGLAGSQFMFDLEQERPALTRVAPAAFDPHTPRLARRVFVVIIDGLRLDKSYELPFIDSLRRRGVDGEAQSHYPTWSRPNYVSILTGVPPEASGVRTNHHSTPVALDSLMDRAKEAGLRTAMATDYDVLPRLFLRARTPRSGEVTREVAPVLHHDDDVDPRVDEDSEVVDVVDDKETAAAVRAPDANLESPFDDARYAPWPGGFSEAGDALAGENADLVVMLLGAVDVAGHAHGGKSEQYRDAALIADHALSRALARVDLERDAIIITADHGHTNRGGHGGVEPEVLTVPFVAVGAGIKPGATPNDAHLIDVAPTVSALLGIAAPGHGLGRTLVEILAGDSAASMAWQVADTQRLTMTRAVVAGAEATAEIDVLENRALRIGLVVCGAALAIGLATLLIRRRVLRLDIRVLLVSVPAFFVVYYGLLGVLGQRWSPSLLPAKGHLAQTLAYYGIAAMAVQLLFSLWALRSQRTLAQRLAAANGIAWMGLMLAMIPAGLAWAFYPPPFVEVPPPLWLVLIPAIEVAVGCAAVSVALTLMLEVIVFASRAWHRAPPAG